MRTRTLWCGVAQNVPPSAGATAPGRDVSARFLWDPLRRRVVSADAGALALFGEARLLDLLRRPFPAGERLGDALAAAADRLRPGGSAEETLTIPGEQIAAVAASLRAAPLPDGRVGLDICVIGGAAPALGGEVALAAAAAGGGMRSSTACAPAPPPIRPFGPAGESGIDHIVVVMMENRSVDHLLGWLPGIDGRQAGLSFTDRPGVAPPPPPHAEARGVSA